MYWQVVKMMVWLSVITQLNNGFFSKLPFQSIRLKWVYSDCFPLDSKQQTNWITWRGTMKKISTSIFKSCKQREIHRCCFPRENTFLWDNMALCSDSSRSAPASIIVLHKWICCSAETIQIQFSSPLQEAKGAENGVSLLIHQFGISRGWDFILNRSYF